MIKRIVFFMLFFDLLVAVSISMVFVASNQPIQPVTLGAPFMALIRVTNQELNSFKLSIPSIPSIPMLQDVSFTGGEWWEAILNALVMLTNGIFTFINGLVNVINFVILALNYIIQLLQFVVLLLKNIITFKDNVQPYIF